MHQASEQATRAGKYVKQVQGYRAFIPRPLPPDPPLIMDTELVDLLSRADQALGRLDGSADTLPNPDLFVTMYVRKEAVLSSQIEGTQASLVDVLEYEVANGRRGLPNDVAEVVNYVRAMNYGLERLHTLPLSNRLLKEIHAELLRGVRGRERSPGEFRQSQNWIGPPACSLREAAFVPPPPVQMEQALTQLELYLHRDTATPVLLKCGLAHAQFETIHPFLDGNGRLGRLLITFLLCQHSVLARPLLYLSAYFKQYRQEYYEHLQAVRDLGDWEGWLKFFLKGIVDVCGEAIATARQILAMREEHRQLVMEKLPGTAKGLLLLDRLYQTPIISIASTAKLLDVSYPTGNSLVTAFVNLGLLSEITGQRRNRAFVYGPYLDIFRKGTEP